MIIYRSLCKLPLYPVMWWIKMLNQEMLSYLELVVDLQTIRSAKSCCKPFAAHDRRIKLLDSKLRYWRRHLNCHHLRSQHLFLYITELLLINKRTLYPYLFSQNGHISRAVYGGVMAWQRFPHHWPFVRGIHRQWWITLIIEGQWCRALIFVSFFVVDLDKLLLCDWSCLSSTSKTT